MFIPKGDGKLRPLGIPCIKDRVVQMAAVLVLEPIFEADLEPEQHAYRPERNALDAVRQVERLLRTGHTEVVDADLSGYFDSIPHAELMKSVSRRISDGRMLRLLKMWLETPVEETDAKGNRHRTTRNKDQGMGTPQGCSDLTIVVKHLHATICEGMEDGRARKATGRDDRQLCRRLCARQCVFEMRVGPSEPACGGGLQTTLSGSGKEPRS